MITISVAQIQKNISMLTKIDEVMEVVDKRRNVKVATIYPANKTNIVKTLAGKYKNRVNEAKNFEKIREIAMQKAMEEKYGKLD